MTKKPRPAFSATPPTVKPPEVAPSPSPPSPPLPKVRPPPTPEVLKFVESLPGRVVASEAETGDKPKAAAKKPATAPKMALTDILAGMEAPKVPSVGTDEPLQRLAVDIPAKLHAKIKLFAKRRGATVRDDVAIILEWFYSKQ